MKKAKGMNEPRYSLEECSKSELEAFINTLRVKSPKTGKPIKINIYKWSKENMIYLLENNHLVSKTLKWINGWYLDLPGYSSEYLYGN